MFSDQFPTRNHKEYNGISISYQGIDVNNKQTIINLFRENIKGRKADLTGYTGRHDGKEGHWLERQMGIDPNNDNEADILGFEMKKDTARITTFGDWSPDKALWKNDTPNPDIPKLDRDTEFLEFFGKPNPLKNNRCSWSGEPAPVIARYNRFGQTLRVDDNDNILALYSFSKDQRENRGTIVPQNLQREDLILGMWEKDSIKAKVERKFNDKGWFKCYKDTNGFYKSIGFGDPINYDSWISLVREGIVFFDSGMYQGNKRPYAHWRANNNYWDALVTERHE